MLGGGVIEACSDFVLPIVENIVGSDQLPGARGRAAGCWLSALGDDAVSLGAVALARMSIGRSPFKRRYAVSPNYPPISQPCAGEVAVGGKTYAHDVYITVDGLVEKRKKKHARENAAARDRSQGTGESLPRRTGSRVPGNGQRGGSPLE